MDLSGYYTPAAGGDVTFSVEAPKIKFGPGSLAEIGDDARQLAMTRVACLRRHRCRTRFLPDLHGVPPQRLRRPIS